MQELIGDYITIEEYYMRQSMRKAIGIEVVEESSLTSSMVDEVFFVVRKSIRRALSSTSVDGICAILNHAVSVLQEDFADVLHAKLKNNTYVAYTIDLSQAYYSMIGTTTPMMDLNAYDKNRKLYLAHLSDAEVSMENIERLVETLEVAWLRCLLLSVKKSSGFSRPILEPYYQTSRSMKTKKFR